MCTYSAFHGQVNPLIPQYPAFEPNKMNPFVGVWPTPDVAKELKALALRLDAIDKKLGLTDCAAEAGEKQKFLDKLQQYIDAERPAAQQPEALARSSQRPQIQQSAPNGAIMGNAGTAFPYMQNFGPNDSNSI